MGDDRKDNNLLLNYMEEIPFVLLYISLFGFSEIIISKLVGEKNKNGVLIYYIMVLVISLLLYFSVKQLKRRMITSVE